jgi:uncharacterized protein (TIGR03382 family)
MSPRQRRRAKPLVHKTASATPQVRQPTGSPWTTTTNAPTFTASTMLQLTDGRLFVQDEDAVDWWFLTPDSTGSYVNGTWSAGPSMSKARLYYASAVLMDGRVVVFGGEYINGAEAEDDTGDVFDPSTNAWTALTGLSTSFNNAIGDAPNAVLNDGTLLVGSIYESASAIWNPANNAWETSQFTMLGASSTEESWVLQPNGSVLAVDNGSDRLQKSEQFIGAGWVEAGDLPVALVEQTCPLDGSLSEETGPALLLNDGRSLFFGGTGHTGLYTANMALGQPGTWAQGPDFPKDSDNLQTVAKDTPAVLLPNGHVLVTGASENPDAGSGGECWGNTSNFFDVDPTTNPVTFTAVARPAGMTTTQPPYEGRMIILPTGEAAFTQGTSALFIYNAVTPDTTNAPVITTAPGFARPGTTITLQGLRFNGMSQAMGYGDDDSEATNYPLVRFSSGTSVYYGKTQNFSTMGVATGTTTVSTDVVIPASTAIPNGTYNMVVVANGVASQPVSIVISTIAPPTVALTAPTPGATLSGMVTAMATAAPATGTTLSSIALSVDGASLATSATSPLSYAWDTTTATNGAHTVSVTATDADQGAAAASAAVTVRNNPVTAFTMPTGSTVSGTVMVSATGTAALGTTLTSLAVTLDGASVASGTSSPQTYTWDTTTLANGSVHALVVTATDADGTTGNTTLSVTVENLPTVQVTAPANAASVGGVVTVTATGAPSTGTTVTKMTLKIDGSQVATGATSPLTFSWDTRTLAEGSSHTLVASATDADGASNTSSTVTVTINNPSAAITAPADGSTVSGSLVTVTATGSPASSATLSTLTISIDGTQVGGGATSPQSYTWDTTKLTNGSHTLVATATDTDGLSVTSPTVTVQVDNSKGCGCGEGGEGTWAMGALAVLAAGLSRRRRFDSAS